MLDINRLNQKHNTIMLSILGLTLLTLCTFVKAEVQRPPNILMIWGDDIGMSNISAYSDGIMGYQTPNIDRIAKEGMKFTDYYGEQESAAGQASFITGQSILRSGLINSGFPGSTLGIRNRDITIAEVLKAKGYVTALFGNNQLGDRNQQLPTHHGFDEFFGNLYHPAAHWSLEDPDYPQDPQFNKQFKQRGVLRAYRSGKLEDTGALTRERMETVDEEFVAATKQFVGKAVKAKKPFFVWLNTVGMGSRCHSASKHQGKSGQGDYNDRMLAHDELVGETLKLLDDLKVAENTIVVYSTDNGARINTWPDAGITPFSGQQNRTWEGAFRVPAMIRWPGKIAPNTVSNEIMSHLDWMPTLAAVAGDTTLKDDLLRGKRIGNKAVKLHLDGYNFLPYLIGHEKKGPRTVFHYFDGQAFPAGIRIGDWKVSYAQSGNRSLILSTEFYAERTKPLLSNLRRDPYGTAVQNSHSYNDWMTDKAPYIYLGYSKTTEFLATFKLYPPSQAPDAWSIDDAYRHFVRKSQGRSD